MVNPEDINSKNVSDPLNTTPLDSVGGLDINGTVARNGTLPEQQEKIPSMDELMAVIEKLKALNNRQKQRISTLENEVLMHKGEVERLARLVTTDILTGLLNRRGLESRFIAMLHSLRRGYIQGLGGVMIDVDNFKGINDTLGHDVGDDIIKSVADALREELRQTDVAARFAGDEFFVLVASDKRINVRKLLDSENPDSLYSRVNKRFLADERVQSAIEVLNAKGKGLPSLSMGAAAEFDLVENVREDKGKDNGVNGKQSEVRHLIRYMREDEFMRLMIKAADSRMYRNKASKKAAR